MSQLSLTARAAGLQWTDLASGAPGLSFFAQRLHLSRPSQRLGSTHGQSAALSPGGITPRILRDSPDRRGEYRSGPADRSARAGHPTGKAELSHRDPARPHRSAVARLLGAQREGAGDSNLVRLSVPQDQVRHPPRADALCDLGLQRQVQALFLLAEPEPEGRSPHGGDR